MVHPHNRKQVYIYDHPESKIRFLEQTLADKDWRATLVYANTDATALAEREHAKQQFAARGYAVREGKTEQGEPTLELHHLGEGSSPREIVQELGVGRGVGKLLMHPSVPIHAGIEAVQSAVGATTRTLKDPARANGFINLVAEGFLFSPDKFGNFFKLRNLLRTSGFGLFLLQSYTYLFVAKTNDEVAFSEFQQKIDHTLKQGGELLDVRYDESRDSPGTGWFHNLVRSLRRYPIQFGAMFNNLGMGLYILAAFMERTHSRALLAGTVPGATAAEVATAQTYLHKGTRGNFMQRLSGFQSDIAGALTSIFSWSFLMVKPKHPSADAPMEEAGPLRRLWNGLRENPQLVSGFGTLSSSSLRLIGATKGARRNQAIGERVYLVGDFALLFTKNDHYGQKTGNIDTLSEGLADYINKMPALLGSKEQEKMVEHMANFLLARGLAEIKAHPKTANFTPDELKERAKQLVVEVGRRVKNSYAEQMEELGDVTARLLGQFPSAQRPAIIEALTQAMPNLTWMYADAAEIRPALTHAMARHPDCQHEPTTRDPAALRKAVADIVDIVPGVDMGGTAALLYDALNPFLQAPGAAKPPGTKIAQIQHEAPAIAPTAGLVNA